MAQAILAETASVATPASGYGSVFLVGTAATAQLKLTDSSGATSAILDVRNTATVTNKTFTTPTINGAALSGTLSGTPTFSGACVFSAAANQFSNTGDITPGSYTTGSIRVDGGLSVAKGLQAPQLACGAQTSATTTGAITFTLTSGANIYLTAALTGAVTMNITLPVIGSRSSIYFTQGAAAQTLTLSMASVVFRQTGTTGTGTGTYSVTNISTVNGFYNVTLYWATATLCYVSVG
jgi:hypothetical protein